MAQQVAQAQSSRCFNQGFDAGLEAAPELQDRSPSPQKVVDVSSWAHLEKSKGPKAESFYEVK